MRQTVIHPCLQRTLEQTQSGVNLGVDIAERTGIRWAAQFSQIAVRPVALRMAVVLFVGVLIQSLFCVRAVADELSIDRVLDPDRLIEVSIELPANDWSELCKQNRDPGKVFSGNLENPFTYFKGNITVDGVMIGSVGIRKKGFLGSLDDRWPSLKVRFDQYQNQVPIQGLDGLTLNNNKQDSSLASQFIAYQLFNAAGVKAPRSNFARVTVNGQYLGIYSNVESIDRLFLKRRFANDTGNLYEGALADFYPKAIDRLEIKTNKKDHNNSKIVRLATLLASKDALAIDEVEQLVDIDNFLRFWAIESLIGFWDGYSNNQNNFWVYENGVNGKFFFMPWGADGAFISAGFPGFGPRGPVSVYSESMLANRLYNDKQIAERYRENMRWILANVWNEAELLKTVDRLETLIKNHLHTRQASAPREMNSVRQFIRTRRELVEKELDAWPVRVAERPRRPFYAVQLGFARGSFTTKWGDRPPASVAATGDIKLQMELEGKQVEFQRSGVSVHRVRQGAFPFAFGPSGQPIVPKARIVIAGIRDAEEKPVTITLTIDQPVLTASLGKSISVQGSIMDGQKGGGSFMPFGGRGVSGNVTLSKIGHNAGDAVEGEFDLKITEMHGGFMDRRAPEGGGPSGPPPDFPMFGMGGPGGTPSSALALTNIREVQDELVLTDDQRKQIQDTRTGLQEQTRNNSARMRDAFELPDDDRDERFQSVQQKTEELNRGAEEQVLAILGPEQRSRLIELKLQREGISALTNPDVMSMLDLTDEQRGRIRTIREANQPAGPFPPRLSEDEQRKLKQEILAVLTDEQKNKWAAMTGKEFKFPNPPFPGPFPGSGASR